MWLAKLTEKGMLRPSFVPPQPIRQLRDYTRLRTDLTHDRSRQVQRLEKLLEDALIKLWGTRKSAPRWVITAFRRSVDARRRNSSEISSSVLRW